MTNTQKNIEENRNLLDGFTILRFSHASDSGGGVEQYIEDLDRTLLNRNKLNILRMYLSDDIGNVKERIEKIGQGTLVKIPLNIGHAAFQTDADRQKTKEPHLIALKNILRDLVVYNPLLYKIIFRRIVKKLSSRPRDIEVQNAKQEAERIFNNFKIDLLIMHYVGGADSEAIIHVAKSWNIPYIFLNHFSNDRLNRMSVREQLADASGIAGVSSIYVPRRLKSSFVNLSDGIDMELFNPGNARPIKLDNMAKVVILPARIVVTKGQSDLIKACAALKKQGIRIKVVLAGRADSLQYEDQLRRLAFELNIIDDILFVGQLTSEQLRDWYGASAILSLPTYNEGLGRCLLEAQAMKVPPVVYEVGGTKEGLQNGKTGFLVPKGDIETLKKRLYELLTNEELRIQMGEDGRNFVEQQFSLQALASRHEEFYLRILKNRFKK